MRVKEGYEGIVLALCMLFIALLAIAIAKLVFGY